MRPSQHESVESQRPIFAHVFASPFRNVTPDHQVDYLGTLPECGANLLELSPRTTMELCNLVVRRVQETEPEFVLVGNSADIVEQKLKRKHPLQGELSVLLDVFPRFAEDLIHAMPENRWCSGFFNLTEVLNAKIGLVLKLLDSLVEQGNLLQQEILMLEALVQVNCSLLLVLLATLDIRWVTPEISECGDEDGGGEEKFLHSV
jgi:hypothetical protein